jgi:hypothetical protein
MKVVLLGATGFVVRRALYEANRHPPLHPHRRVVPHVDEIARFGKPPCAAAFQGKRLALLLPKLVFARAFGSALTFDPPQLHAPNFPRDCLRQLPELDSPDSLVG